MDRKFYDSSDFSWHSKVRGVERKLARMLYNQTTGIQQDKNGNPLQVGDTIIQTLRSPSSQYTVANFISDHIVTDNGELFHWSNVIKVGG